MPAIRSKELQLVQENQATVKLDWKVASRGMANGSTAQKSKNQKNYGSTTGNAGVNKDAPTLKNCDEHTSLLPSKISEKGMAGKSASNDRRELVILAASITELKDTMAMTS